MVIGGNKENDPTCEELDIASMQWRTVNVSNIRIITNWKCMGYSAYTTEIDFLPQNAKIPVCKNPNRDYNDISLIFGTDDEPFILEIDRTTSMVEVKPCPLKLKLKNYQGVN